MKKNDTRFEDFLADANDEIDNAVYSAICSMSTDEVKWDMYMIGEVEDLIRELLEEKGVSICHPFYEEGFDGDRTPCYRGTDCCNRDCPFYAMLKMEREHSA